MTDRPLARPGRPVPTTVAARVRIFAWAIAGASLVVPTAAVHAAGPATTDAPAAVVEPQAPVPGTGAMEVPDVTLRPPGTAPDGSVSRHGIQHWGVKIGYGWSKQRQTGVIPFYGQVGWSFPDWLDKPLLRWHLDFQYVLEAWAGGTHSPYTSAFEIGVNPISLRLAWDRGQQFVPYLQGGLGVMYTSLQGVRTGGPFEFDELFGIGIEAFVTKRFALTVEYRYRHMSNAGIYEDNRGLDTQFVLFGITEHPQR
ncbi:MAG: acyloxyacyl hydrolase [Alphaproteobacteria bacterium]